MKKIIKIFITCIIIIFIMLAAYMVYNKSTTNKIKINDDEQYIASMYYSYMIGMDAGTEYLIYIYNNNENSYKYKITKSNITIAGSTEPKEHDRGIIKSKKDLIKLDKKFISKKENNVGLSNSSYRIENRSDDVLNIEDLASELFK